MSKVPGQLVGVLPTGDDAEVDVVELFPVRSDIGMRLDRYVAAGISDLSRTYLQQLIDAGNVRVDGQVRRASFKITPGQRVTVEVPEAAEVDLLPEDIALDVIYADADVIVLDKPAGMVVHPAPGHRSGTLVNALLYHYPDIAIAGSNRPGLVHRLDKDTSGVMVVARNDRAHISLVAQWQDRTVDKRYVALVAGGIEEAEATIDAPIARDPSNRLRMAARRDGKEAVSHFAVTERFSEATLLDVSIETGRTHQIRVHLAMIGHPVLGDHLYANHQSRLLAAECGIERQMLHARTLAFTLPGGHRKSFHAPLPKDMLSAIDRLRTSAP
jgi:23S rRNA pseudouridine1911/1915/1917 synthase